MMDSQNDMSTTFNAGEDHSDDYWSTKAALKRLFSSSWFLLLLVSTIKDKSGETDRAEAI